MAGYNGYNGYKLTKINRFEGTLVRIFVKDFGYSLKGLHLLAQGRALAAPWVNEMNIQSRRKCKSFCSFRA